SVFERPDIDETGGGCRRQNLGLPEEIEDRAPVDRVEGLASGRPCEDDIRRSWFKGQSDRGVGRSVGEGAPKGGRRRSEVGHRQIEHQTARRYLVAGRRGIDLGGT